MVAAIAQLEGQRNVILSVYLMPPQIRLEECLLVLPTKSPRSISATLMPLPARPGAVGPGGLARRGELWGG